MKEEINMKEKVLKGTAIHYWINDNKSEKSIIFLHPAFADHTCFDEQVKYFSENYRVITLDLIGHGKSLGKGKITDTASDINKIMIVEKIEKINLVGVSIGAILIQDFANKYPHKVESLCAIGGYDINNFDSSIQKGNTGEQMKMMFKAIFSVKWFAEDNKKISAYTKDAQEKFYKMNLNFKKSSFIYLASLNSLVNKQKTKKRKYPLLIGVGEHDNPMALTAAKMWKDTEKDAIFKVFKGAGHIVNMDTPDEFNKELEIIL